MAIPFLRGLRAPQPIAALVVVLVACGSATLDDTDAAQSDEHATEACFRLSQSPAHVWPTTLPPVLALGAAASEALTRMLRDAPNAPGAPAIAAALGRVGGSNCWSQLTTTMRTADEAVAAEAALALGRLRATRCLPDLRRTMRDPAYSPLVRTAAASAILQQERDQEAIDFLCDIILAATSEGRARGQALGLPVDRPRWALERNLAITALTVAAGDRQLHLDADSSWPRLAAAVRSARDYFKATPP